MGLGLRGPGGLGSRRSKMWLDGGRVGFRGVGFWLQGSVVSV